MSRRTSVTFSILDDPDRFIANRKRGHPAPPYTDPSRAHPYLTTSCRAA